MALQRQYGVQHIFFSDEAITPRNLSTIALPGGTGHANHWGGCARFEEVISR